MSTNNSLFQGTFTQNLHPLVTTFCDIEQALQVEKAPSETAQVLLNDTHQCLQSLCDWVSISQMISLSDLLRASGTICSTFSQEAQCWEEDNHEKIASLIGRAAAWIPKSDDVYSSLYKRLQELQRLLLREATAMKADDAPAPTTHLVRLFALSSASSVSKGEQKPLGRFIPALNEVDAVVQARLLKALADPTRLRILSLLSRHEGEVCVFEMVESFTLEQPTISHHLRILRDAGLVDYRKKGLWAYYYVRREALTRAGDVINGLV